MFPLVLAVRAGRKASSGQDVGRDIRVIPADSRHLSQLLVAARRYARKNWARSPQSPFRGPEGLCRGAPSLDPARTMGAYAKGGS
ncbi:hypothetical protein GCM10010433_34250 [Streptomyces pulveraceus]